MLDGYGSANRIARDAVLVAHDPAGDAVLVVHDDHFAGTGHALLVGRHHAATADTRPLADPGHALLVDHPADLGRRISRHPDLGGCVAGPADVDGVDSRYPSGVEGRARRSRVSPGRAQYVRDG